jgi:hypothetical protein
MLVELIRLLISVVLLAAVPAVCWRFLFDRRGGIEITVGCTIGYLVLGNLLSQVVLLDVIFPADPGSTGHSLGALQRLLFLHTLICMGASAFVAVGVAAGLARVLQPKG